MNNNESAEDYLETILVLSKSQPVVRSIDIVEEIGFKKSSVSVAMKNLRNKDYIAMTDEGHITLTEAGQKIAETIYERHQLISAWLKNLGVNEKPRPKMPAALSILSVSRVLRPSRTMLTSAFLPILGRRQTINVFESRRKFALVNITQLFSDPSNCFITPSQQKSGLLHFYFAQIFFY